MVSDPGFISVNCILNWHCYLEGILQTPLVMVNTKKHRNNVIIVS